MKQTRSLEDSRVHVIIFLAFAKSQSFKSLCGTRPTALYISLLREKVENVIDLLTSVFYV